jgi:hypothetical protein
MLWCLGPASAFAADYTFTGKAMAPHNEDWSQAENWDPTNGPPGDGDTVTIGTSDNGFFVNVDSAVTVESVTVISSILQGGGSLSVSGDMECLYAQLMPGGGITVEGGLFVEPVPDIPDYRTTTLSCPMTLDGTSIIYSNAVLQFGAAVALINNATLNLQGGAQLVLLADPGSTFINNGGLDAVLGGTAIVSTSDSLFSNGPTGSVIVSSGTTLEIQGTLADSGIFNVDSNALIIDSANTAFHDQASFDGAGTMLLEGGDSTLDGTVTIHGNFLMGSNSVPVITMNGTLEVGSDGTFEWLGGGLTGVETNVTGTILIDTNGVMEINNLNGLTLKNVVVTNNGFINWVDSGVLFMGYNAQIVNAGFFIAFADGQLQPLSDGSPGFNVASVQNIEGTFEKQLGSTSNNAATTIGIPFYSGDVTVYEGNLSFTAGASINTWAVGSDAAIQLKGGTYSLAQDVLGGIIKGLAGYGVGTVTMNSGVILWFAELSVLVVDGGEFIQSGGTINGGYSPLYVVNGGQFVWHGGTISNAEIAIDASSVMNMSAGTIVGSTITNAGTVNWTNGNGLLVINAGDSVVFNNAGQFNIGCDSYFNDVSTNINTRPVLTNEVTGVITKAGTSGTSDLGIALVNLGKIIAQQGNLELAEVDDLAGLDYFLLEGGKITFDDPTVIHGKVEGSGAITANEGLTFSDDEVDVYLITFSGDITNDGTFILFYGAPGELTLQGNNFTQTANGRLVIPVRGTNAVTKDFGQLIVSGYGEATLAGRLVAVITNGYAPPVGASFPFLTSYQRNGTFTNVMLPQGMTLNYTGGGATLVVTSAVPVQITSPAVTNGQFQFGFNTVTNRSYTVQYTDDLSTGAWTYLTNLTGDGSFWQSPPLASLAAHRFFRVSNP